MKSRVPAILYLCLLMGSGSLVANEPVVARRMAITFDDLPAQRAQALPEPKILAINEGFVKTLTDQQIPAIGFVNEGKLHVDGALDPARVRLLELWLDAGLELGNHTFSHPELHRTPLEEFQQDLIRGEPTTAAWVQEVAGIQE